MDQKPDGVDLRQLTISMDHEVAWSPDGQRMASFRKETATVKYTS